MSTLSGWSALLRRFSGSGFNEVRAVSVVHDTVLQIVPEKVRSSILSSVADRARMACSSAAEHGASA